MSVFSKGITGEPVNAVDETCAEVVQVPASMLLRDVIYRMNELFATTAAIVNSQGRIVGWLTQSLLVEHFARDADQALRSPCEALLGLQQTDLAA